MLARLGVKHLVAVIGAVYGGYQAFQWAVTYPDDMKAVICVNTAPKGSGDQRQTEALIARLAEDPTGTAAATTPMAASPDPDRHPRRHPEELRDRGPGRPQIPDPAAREAEIRRLATPWAQAFDGNSLVTLRRAAVDFDAQKDFARIKAKVLYALTTTDRLFPPSIAPAVMQRLAEAKVDASFSKSATSSGIWARCGQPGLGPDLAAFMAKASA